MGRRLPIWQPPLLVVICAAPGAAAEQAAGEPSGVAPFEVAVESQAIHGRSAGPKEGLPVLPLRGAA